MSHFQKCERLYLIWFRETIFYFKKKKCSQFPYKSIKINFTGAKIDFNNNYNRGM